MKSVIAGEIQQKIDNKSLTEWSGAGYTDAVAAMNCPKCGAAATSDCRTPKGRKAWPPHVERTSSLFDCGYSANRVTAVNTGSLLSRLIG